MELSIENSIILLLILGLKQKSTKNSRFFQKWRNLSYNKINKAQGEHYGIQTLWRNHSKNPSRS